MSTPVASEHIAVVGIGCRFPGGANSPERFWTLLCDGTDAITEVPRERFDLSELYDADPAKPGKLYTRWGGFVDAVDAFDAEFFGISPREAVRIDPQQRMLLEVVWEALEDGGLPADRLAGSNTGVFIGISTHDYYDLQVNPGNRHLLNPHSSTGTATSIAANRISYIYDFRGPSFIVDTACSSSLTAVHLACRSLRTGECDLAIAGGVNAILTPDVAIGFCKASMLSPDGRCKAFDSRANGFVRGEGAGIVVLKPLRRAIADGNRIYAIVRGSAVNQDGRTVGIAVPSAEAQEALIREALHDADASPDDVRYIEAHGTGTRVGDPIEASAIGHVLSNGHHRSSPCLIGSAKTNIGHLEAAAGIAGLIKASLVLHHRQIPPSLHFHEGNPGIPFEDLQLRVATSLQPLPHNGAPAMVGVNSFGFGGANAHVILEEPPASTARLDNHDTRAHILPLSARHPEALRELARRYRGLVASDACPPLPDLCHSAAVHRAHQAHRVALVGSTREELLEQLDALVTTGPPDVPRGTRGREPKVAFVFTGMGPQWWAMGRQLFEQEPVFRQAIEDCDRRFRRIATWGLLDALMADESVSRAHEADQAVATNFAIQIGLVALLKSWGIAPDAILGHSAGEMAAACAAGAMSHEDGLLWAFHRGRLQHRASGSGTMLSAGLSEDAARQIIAPVADRVSIAAINSPTSVTLSGERHALEQIAVELATRSCFNRFLQVEVPYHGPQMDALRAEFLEALSPIAPQAPSIPFLSTVSGTWSNALLGPQYWFDNLREPVRFADAINRLIDDDYDLFLEIGPHPVLSASLTECLTARGKSGTTLPTLRRKEDERRVMLRSLATLYGHGRRVEWATVCADGTLVPLPTYPWQREHLWFEPDARTTRSSGLDSGHPLLGFRLRAVQPIWEIDLGAPDLDYLNDHIVQGSPVFPAAAYVDSALAAAKALTPDAAPVIENLTFKKVLFLTHRQDTVLQSSYDTRSSSFEIHSGGGDGQWTLNAAGKLRGSAVEAVSRILDLTSLRQRCTTEVPVDEAYDSLEKRGLGYQGLFRGIRSLWRGQGEALAEIGLPEGHAGVAPYHVHPALLDSAFQAMLAAVWSAGTSDVLASGLYLPVSLKRVTLAHEPGARFWAHAEVTVADADTLEGNITIVDEHGLVALSVEGLRCKSLEDAARTKRASRDELTYRLLWEPKPLETGLVRGAEPIRTSAELAASIGPTAERLADERGWAVPLRRAEPTLDAIVSHFARAAFISLGWDGREPAPGGAQALAERLGVAPRHHRFFARLLEIVREVRPIDVADGQAASERAAANRLCDQVLSDFPEGHALIELLRRCGERLDAVLRGEVDAREVLFAPAAVSAWARFFAELPWYEFYNRIAADAIAAAVEQVPGAARLRVLEIGAGTAGTTASVLPRLEGRAVEYHFTDVSPFFLAQARDRFRHQPHVHVTSLDIETEPVAQLGPGTFDVILAANVVHATADLKTTLANIKQVLAPGGLLVLLEVTRKMAWTDLIFGITDGWWRFTDTDLRPAYPLMGVRRWQALLTDAGFEGPVGIAERYGDGDPLQAVILATLPDGGAGVATSARTTPARDWLVFADATGVAARVAAVLRSRGDRCVTVRPGDAFTRREAGSFEIDASSVDHAARLLDALAADGFGLHGVIHAWSLDAPGPSDLTGAKAVDAQRTICGSVLSLLKACERRARPLPPLWLVTAGAQAVEGGLDGPNVAQSPLWGFGRVLTSEQPAARCRLVDIGPAPGADEIAALVGEIAADDLEEEIGLRGSQRYVTRLRRTRLGDLAQVARKQEMSPDERAFRLDIDTPGALESLTLRETVGAGPGPGEILIRVLAAGVNFRDVMLALGLLPPMALPGNGGRTVLGFECAGIVMACGDGVRDFRPGDEVMAVALGAFGSQVVTRAEMAARKPVHLTFEEAATIPLVFVTAYYGLHHLARLSAGERVLIHAGTGGVGLAAIQLAKRAGAVIFATAGNPEKRAYLKDLGIEHVMDSRSLAFADEVMAATGGEGVDVVLNSLAGEAIAKGLSVLRPYGRFLEMGKRDIYADSPIGLLPFDRNLSFSSIALERMCVDRPAHVGAMLREIAALIAEHALEPIPHTAYDLAHAEDAVRFLAQARHIGKIVLTVREAAYTVAPDTERPLCRPDATYVVSGGLGGFGLQVARWMVDHGARQIALISRSGAPAPENEAAFAALRELPANIAIVKGDVSRKSEVARVFEEIRATMPPVGGIVHAAMVLEDVPLALLSPDQLNAVLAPKVAGAWNLHEATARDTLDFFVMFSSIASVLGTKGQGNYAAANLFLDALAPYRRSIGLPALTVNWGALSDVGYLSQHQDVAQHLHRHGLDSFTPAEALDVLSETLRLDVSQLMAARLDWQRWSRVDAAAVVVKRTQRLAHLASADQSAAHDGAAERGGVLPLLAGAAPGERPALLERHVVERVAKVLGTAAKKVDAEQPLTEMGVDSLMAVELQTIVDRDLGVSLPLASLLEGATARQLAATLLDQLDFEAVAPAPVASPEPQAPSIDSAAVQEAAAPPPLVREWAPAPAPGQPDEAPRPRAVPDAAPALAREEGREAAPVRPSVVTEAGPSIAASREPLVGAPARGGVDYRSIDYRRWSPLQRFSQKVIAGLFRLLAPLEVHGIENIPRSGPVVVAVNHLSMLDVALVLTILPRRGICIATDSLRRNPWLRWFLDIGDTIYVRRGEADQEALAKGLAVLRAGGLLGVAPEGTRSRTGGLIKGQPGVVLMAGEAPAPILPLVAWGQERVVENLRRLKRTPIRVRIGTPISVSTGERTAAKLQRDTERVMRALAEMLPPAYRGVYADAVGHAERSTADVASAR